MPRHTNSYATRLATRARRLALASLPVLATLLALPAPLPAQSDSARASVALHDLLGGLARSDRRRAQLALLERQSALRTRTVNRELLPTASALASGQYVSDVPSIGGSPMVPYQQYDAYITVRQRIFDPTRGIRRDLESAQLDEAEARVHSALWQQRQQLSDAFFTLLALDAERSTLEAALGELETLRRLAATRVAAGTALGSEVALLDAELLRRRQALDDIDANRSATRAVLISLSGTPIGDDTRLALPELGAAADAARRALDTLSARPEYAQFDGSRAVLAARAKQVARADLPKLSAFARSGYGRPGINPLARDFQSYWVAGLQLEWTPQLWGASSRDAEVQQLQQEIVATEAAQFRDNLTRAVQRDLAAMDRLGRALESDEAIIALHERVASEARRRFGEGSITAGELVDRETDLLTARTARELHRVRLVEAQARFLTTVGQEIP